ncbi:GGDEF domain-containing protein [Levilinea saccharolytica]|uniref:GGDEF domain-containing protein n=1 Tax=Levilinea saccharolytica TaxID=229921 RepID=UPI000783D33C|nr:GGDEF domain-containing protein [Levilinea saccharolytica]GAP18808.1 protein containing diguanylate cyclase (GGDEF) domain [Levilinea saccharolytica]
MNDRPAGLAFICDPHGIIKTILMDEIGVRSLAVGQFIGRIADPGSRIKVLNFIADLRAKGAAVQWEVNILVDERTETIPFSGVSHKGCLMILGSRDVIDSLRMCDELIQIDPEPAALLRAAIQSHLESHESESLEQLSIYDQISRLNNELINLQRDLMKKNAELESLNRTIQMLASTDMLTGQNNRMGFFDKGEQQVAQAMRYHHPLSAMMFDVDKFKTINDTYGHSVGDKALAELAARCHSVLRKVDILGRYGGDEFAILLPETSSAGACVVAERMRQAVSQPMQIADQTLTVTISIGIAELDLKNGDLETLLQHADRALYAAKDAGRNCIFVDNGEGG